MGHRHHRPRDHEKYLMLDSCFVLSGKREDGSPASPPSEGATTAGGCHLEGRLGDGGGLRAGVAGRGGGDGKEVLQHGVRPALTQPPAGQGRLTDRRPIIYNYNYNHINCLLYLSFSFSLSPPSPLPSLPPPSACPYLFPTPTRSLARCRLAPRRKPPHSPPTMEWPRRFGSEHPMVCLYLTMHSTMIWSSTFRGPNPRI